jgi:two-component system, OmpR family, alkaline phosphatase synthesis response regulator PhoP
MSKQKKIIIVEDDKFLTKIYRLNLENEGYKLVIVNDGKRALDVIQTEMPNLIMLDVILPNMTGLEILDDLKKTTKLKNIPVIMLSNLGQQKDIDKAINTGADDYFINAEVTIEEIIKKIGEYL